MYAANSVDLNCCTKTFLFLLDISIFILIQPSRSLVFLSEGNDHGRAFRDLDTEKKVLDLTRAVGIGAQFGGKYFCHDVRVIRLPRHGASCPVGMGVSCSADRQVSNYSLTLIPL